MRLTCPNCGAEYDVPEGLVPPDGRHVQCTACHTRWFMRGRAREELSEDQILRKLETRGERPRPLDPRPEGDAHAPIPFPAPSAARADTAPEPPEPSREFVEVSGPAGVPDNTDDAPKPEFGAGDPVVYEEIPGDSVPLTDGPEEEKAKPVEAVLAAPRPGLDLRPAPPSPARPAIETAAPVAARSIAEDAEPRLPALREAPRAATPRPRIEVTDTPTTPVAPERRRRRFLPGFILALLIVGLVVEIYVWRDPLAAQVPAAAPAIHGYADRVDVLREWLRDHAEAMGITKAE